VAVVVVAVALESIDLSGLLMYKYSCYQMSELADFLSKVGKGIVITMHHHHSFL